MHRFGLSMIVGMGLMFLVRPASAQSPATEPKTSINKPTGRNRSDAKAEADRITNEHRLQAHSLLISLAGDARTFRDLKLRARSLAGIADVLWSINAEQGHALFRKAWEAAETADENQGATPWAKVP